MLFIFIGPKVMKNRKPFDLKREFAVYASAHHHINIFRATLQGTL